MSNYTNKYITFYKGEYVGHLEPTTEEIEEREKPQSPTNPDAPTMHTITIQ